MKLINTIGNCDVEDRARQMGKGCEKGASCVMSQCECVTLRERAASGVNAWSRERRPEEPRSAPARPGPDVSGAPVSAATGGRRRGGYSRRCPCRSPPLGERTV
ncbi:hypothetical protein GCM10027091_43010 [Streptomyces daliensis]